MSPTLVLWIVVAGLLVIEWRRKWPAIRVLLVFMALLQLWFAQPTPYRAFRAVYNLPPDQRVTTWDDRDSVRLDDYRSGVLTLWRAVSWELKVGTNDRLIAMGVLVWLAISPVIPRRFPPWSKPDTGIDEPAA